MESAPSADLQRSILMPCASCSQNMTGAAERLCHELRRQQKLDRAVNLAAERVALLRQVPRPSSRHRLHFCLGIRPSGNGHSQPASGSPPENGSTLRCLYMDSVAWPEDRCRTMAVVRPVASGGCSDREIPHLEGFCVSRWAVQATQPPLRSSSGLPRQGPNEWRTPQGCQRATTLASDSQTAATRAASAFNSCPCASFSPRSRQARDDWDRVRASQGPSAIPHR